MLKVFTIEQSEEWDNIIKSFGRYDVYYLSAYVKAFILHGDGTPLLFYYENGRLRAINVVMKRDIAEAVHLKGKIPANTFFDLSTPYGYGGFLFEGDTSQDEINSLNERYTEYCSANNIISEFVRFHPVLQNAIDCQKIYEVIDLGKTVTMKLHSRDQIWSDLSSKNRNVIRKAKREGVEIFWGRSPDLVDKFVPIYNATMSKDEATQYYYFSKEFYDSVLQDLKHNGLFFYAEFEKKTVAMSMIIFANQNMHYHLSASDREHQRLAANNLLLYEAARWGLENGYTSFHLGGGLGSQEDNLYKFKKAFNRNSDTYFSIGKKVFDYKKYVELTSFVRSRVLRRHDSEFFPAYR